MYGHDISTRAQRRKDGRCVTCARKRDLNRPDKKEKDAKYAASPKGRISHRKSDFKYRHSLKGKETQAAYDSSKQGAERRERHNYIRYIGRLTERISIKEEKIEELERELFNATKNRSGNGTR